MKNVSSSALLVVSMTVLTLLLQDCGTHGEGADRFSDIRSRIRDFMEDENVPSVSVAVAQNGRIIWEESFGWANREKNIKASRNTMYELASISKVFTTTGLMVLKERGSIDIDAPVEAYLGDIRIKAYGANASGVTLRRIIQHTSGLPMFWGEPWLANTDRADGRKHIFDRYAILAFKPGERELYSNLGIALLTRVIETMSGQSYAEFLEHTIFLPLGMTNTLYFTSPAMTDSCAQEYTIAGKPWTYTEGLYASAHDLLRFGMFHLKDRLAGQRPILDDSTIDLMQTSVDPRSDFRLPWLVREYEGYRALVFTGASGTIIALLPEADLAIVVLANRLQADTPRIARWIADVILDDFDESTRIPTRLQTHRKIRPESLSRDALTGMWKGFITTSEADLPVEMSFSKTSFPRMRSMNNTGSWTNWVETMPSLRGDYSAGIFSAYFPIQIPIEETKEHDHWTWVYVGLDGDTLRGYAVAHAAGGPHFGLPYYIALGREKHGTEE